MKISQLISILEDVKKYNGDQYIWQFEADSFPCPREIEVELTKVLKRTDHVMSGGNADDTKSLKIYCEYEDGVDLLDRYIEEEW